MEHTQPDPLPDARDFLKAGRSQEASAVLARFLRQNPSHEREWHMLSYALADPEQQVYAVQRVLEINPRNPVARSSLDSLQAAPPQTPSAIRPGPRPEIVPPDAALPEAPQLVSDTGSTFAFLPPARHSSQLFRLARQAFTPPSLAAGSLLILFFLAVAIAAPILAPHEGDVPSIIPRDGYGSVPQPPSPGHPLGTMEAPNDIFYGLVWGTRAAFRLSLIITLGRALVGVFLGLGSGHFGGLLVLVAADIGMMVVWMAALNFVGLIRGQKAMMVADWGQMLSFARGWIVATMVNPLEYWYTFFPVTAAILLFSVGWNLIGDGLRDVFDPRLQRDPLRFGL